MNKQSEPQNPFDVTRYLNGFKIPGVDMQSLMDSQRKNIEALTEANKLALEGMQTVFKRQVEILREAMEESANVAKELTAVGSAQDKIMRQTEVTKAAFERALQNSRELSDMMRKSNVEAFELLNKRFGEVMNEMKESMAKLKKH
jgi:phasin family protein